MPSVSITMRRGESEIRDLVLRVQVSIGEIDKGRDL